ncbi:hypothetical protein OUZ56_003187 [Daphnia magna]|uniref:PiggyBac transposable element-derived protein domain-containing protein n=1 Tax=Daphnia magna TaxID=35525 RepID=A0ABR0A866_9CRUS|nr:hypothetical protein OUZ56_003187 [Daphnia magna]
MDHHQTATTSNIPSIVVLQSTLQEQLPTSDDYGSESTEKMGKLLNEVFDVLDGRCINKRIKFNNWTKKNLDAMMHILNVTFRLFSEKEKYPNSPSESFMSQTTLLSFMMNVRSTIALTKEFVNARYITRFFGIVRSFDNHPTCHS